MQSISFLLFFIDSFVSTFEKVKNLVTWKNKTITFHFYCLFILFLIVFTMLPTRYLIILGLIN